MRSYEKSTAYYSDYQETYITVYDQPAHSMLVAWLYHHIWEKFTWRIWRKLERFQDKPSFDCIPFTNRQDERCYYLTNKNRTNIGTLHKTLDEKG